MKGESYENMLPSEESIAKKKNELMFGFIKDLDIPSEYTKIRLKISKLSSDQRQHFMLYVSSRRKSDQGFNEMINKLDDEIYNKLKEVTENENKESEEK